MKLSFAKRVRQNTSKIYIEKIINLSAKINCSRGNFALFIYFKEQRISFQQKPFGKVKVYAKK
jgi:hypothetical protein